MKNRLFLLPTFALASLALASSTAATTLYSDDFSGNNTTNLHGPPPDTTVGTNTWIAHPNWKADGSIAGVSSIAADHSAFLPFTPTTGKVYTLSATLAKPSGAPGQWAAIGFTNDTLGTATGNNSQSFFAGTNAAAPWMLYRANNSDIVAWAGPGTSVAADNNSGYSGDQTMTIKLDTTGAQWKAEWFVGDSSIHSFTYETNPTISYVGLGRENGVAADFSSFTLSVSPGEDAAQPRITSFTGVGGGLWELTLVAVPNTAFEFYSSTDLTFTPGTLVENLTQGDPDNDPGTIGGTNNSVVTTDANGNAKLRLTLTGQPADFVRAQTVGPPPPLLAADFEDNPGGFTATAAAGTPWAWGDPDSTGPGGTVSTGNGGSVNCWGTNPGNPGFYLNPTTGSRLISPVIDLTAVAAANLSFAQALDFPGSDTAVVRVFRVVDDSEIISGPFPLTVTDADTLTANWQNSGPLALPVGEPIRIEWIFSGTGNGTGDYMGWYVDDVLVTEAGP